MAILCGTDFSTSAENAVRVAALLAVRLGEPLRLVHVVDELGAELTMRTEPHSDLYNPIRLKLRGSARRARELGAQVEEEFVAGHTAEILAAAGARTDLRIVVVSSLGERAPARWLLGSVPEKVARTSRVPVLVVRDANPFEQWLRGERHLKVMLGVDSSESSDAAVRWAGELQRIEPCDVTLTHVTWPPREHDRLGLGTPMDLEKLHPDVEKAVLRELQTKAEGLGREENVRCLVRQGYGRVDHHLVSLAEEAGVDLLIVGSHQRSGVDRLWHGSVSRGVLHLASMNVASIPKRHGHEQLSVPQVRRVLVATDFSETGNRAVPVAASLLPNGGTIHLVHVLTPVFGETPVTSLVTVRGAPREEWLRRVAAAKDRLDGLVPEIAASRRIAVIADLLEGYVAEEVCRAAERLEVDILCIGSRARPGLSAALLGSAAQEIVARSRRPILIVPPRER